MSNEEGSLTGHKDPGGAAAEGAARRRSGQSVGQPGGGPGPDGAGLGREAGERQVAEERLRFQSLVLDQINDAVVTVDGSQRVTYFNRAAERQYGVSAEEALGHPLREVYQYRWVMPGDEAEAAEALARAGFWRGENIHVRRDGAELHVESAVSALRDEAGEPSGLLAIMRDVTSRGRAEKALRESEERLRLVVESATDYAIFTLDTEGRIESWNVGAERVFGYAAEEVTGRHTEVLFTPEDRGRGVAEDEMRRAREQGRAEDERWHTSKRGVRFYVSGVLAPLRDAGGALTGYVKIARDRTERQELEEALRRAHAELEERVRERTHELQETAAELLVEVKERAQAEERVRSLLRQLVTVQEEERRRVARELHDTLGQQLAALSLSIDIIKAESEGTERLREHVGRTQAIFERLNSDVDFLAWELRPAALDQLGLDAAIRTFVREWSEHFSVKAHYHGPGREAPRLPPEVETNLYRILQEALQNTHKHAGAGRVSVQLQQYATRAVLVVEDNGRGYNLQAEVSSGGGKAMGVINMRERAALIGGELEIESSPGSGVTIYVRVPVSRPGEKGDVP